MRHGKEKIYLHPGDFVFGDRDCHLHTLLGSCISITLWHPEKKIGGMCHYTLPHSPSIKSANKIPSGKYADGALALFKKAAKKHGTVITEYEAKIFGGGSMIRSQGDRVDDTVGTRNSSAAMQLLMQEGVNILVAHVGEFGHRRIVFDILTGEVWVKHQSESDRDLPTLSGRS